MIGRMKFTHRDGVFTKCEIRGKKGTGVGIAWSIPDAKESKLTGETIAMYKAEACLAKNNIKELKRKIKYLEDLRVYLFPAKFYGREVDWIKLRFDRMLDKEKKELESWEEEYIEIQNCLMGYLADREKSLKRIKKYKDKLAAQAVDSDSTETQN